MRQCANDVDPDHLGKIGAVGVLYGASHTAAGIDDDEIGGAAKARLGGGEEAVEDGIIGGVSGDADEGRAEFVLQGRKLCGRASAADDGVSGGDELAGGRFSDAAGGAGDDGDARVALGHFEFSVKTVYARAGRVTSR